MTSILSELSKPPAVPEPDTQTVCIDLPGETVRCWRSKDKLDVILRKHRDVIFQFKLKPGATYTVHSEPADPFERPPINGRERESLFSRRDFYNVRNKKLVEARLKHRVTFADGERLHLWVGREFNGVLVVKQGEQVIGRYRPNALAPFNYGPDPKAKPAPLIVVLDASHPPAAAPASAPPAGTADDVQTMHIVEVTPGLGVLPDEVADFFKKGGEDTAVDTGKLMTRNWLWAQITGGVAYVGDNLHWIRELWSQKFMLSKVKDKAYIIFKGNHKLREFLKGTRYLADNPAVVAISAGAGTIRGAHKAAWEATKGAFKGAAKFALVLTITLDFAEWLADYEERDPKTGKPKRDFYDLGAKIFTDVAWAAMGAALGSAGMALVGIPLALKFGVAFVGVIAVGGVAAAVITGLGLAWLDSQIGITPKFATMAREAAQYLDSKYPRDYSDYQSSVDEMLLRGMP